MIDVSVVIPAYCAERFIERAIHSVVMQQDVNAEIIVIEDGCYDRTADIVSDYGGVRLLRNATNMGAQYSRNRGLAAAKGRNVLFLDADDFVEGPLLSSLRDSMESERRVLSFGPWCRAWQDASKPRDHHCPAKQSGSAWLAGWLTGYFVPTCAVMWSTDALRSIGGWNDDVKKNQDGEVVMRALMRGFQPAVAHGGLGVYWQHRSVTRITNAPPRVVSASSRIIADEVTEWLAGSKQPEVAKALSHFCYFNARGAYKARLDNEGDDWLARARANGLLGHAGTLGHRVFATLVTLKWKERFSDWVARKLNTGPQVF